MIIKEYKEKHDHSKKSKNPSGISFETLISYNLSQRFYIEDIQYNGDNSQYNFFVGQNFNVNEIKKEIYSHLCPNHACAYDNNLIRNKLMCQFNNFLIEFYSNGQVYNNIYVSSDSYSSDSSNNNNKIKPMKDLGVLEIDLFFKDIDGRILIKFFKEMEKEKRFFCLTQFYEIKANEKYNISIEITTKTDDIIIKKTSQIFKYIAFYNFLYKLNDMFIDKEKVVNDAYKYFKGKTKFINFKNKLIILTISDGDFNEFLNLQNNINQNKNSTINNLNNINLAFNVYMIYYFNYGEIEKKILDLKQNNENLQKVNEDLNKRVTKLENMIKNLNENNAQK